jgi:alpha-amylase/alpha-mannosidase (GH57 family)
MQRYLCIHGHFYQPPRENPWLEAIEIQDSAFPYHDWNEKITVECYAPNSASRNLDSEGRILDIQSNYTRINFNFGPTLLCWMEKYVPEIYQAILEADRQSAEWRSGHGNAIAQVYNHIIMPLANTRDKRTQIVWGIKDFEFRFNRYPEGMWLAETAVDTETLEVLAEHGIKFTILAPRQASKVRRIGTGKWKDVRGSKIDPTRAYICKLPSGRTIDLFFYDGPISQAVAFERLLKSGEDFAARLLCGFSETREWPEILHIATDGETYGHHQKFGEMALAFALNYIESRGLARITNYAEYLSIHPPTHEVKIFENSSWSCIHGIERWRDNCGCNAGRHPGWHQKWRKPLREAIDWLRDRLAFVFENASHGYLKDPWKARDDYIRIIIDRSDENIGRFIEQHALPDLNREEIPSVLKLMELQRHTMLMYTSCGWFFDELSDIETVQILQYAGRAIQLSEDIFNDSVEESFKARLSLARSNIPEHKNGAVIYENLVKPAMIDLKKVSAHYAVSSLFEDYIEKTRIYSYDVDREDYLMLHAGNTKVAVGRIRAESQMTHISDRISLCVLYFGGQALNGGARAFLGDEAYRSMKTEVISAFENGEFAEIVRLMDKHFGMHNYSFTSLFRDQQRTILDSLISETMEDIRDSYRKIYENNKILMGLLQNAGMPVKRAFLHAAEVTLNFDLERLLLGDIIDVTELRNLHNEILKWNISVDVIEIEFKIRKKLEQIMKRWCEEPDNTDMLIDIQKRLKMIHMLSIEMNNWHIQNIFYKGAKEVFPVNLRKAQSGDKKALQWVSIFKNVGQMLFFNINSVLPEG